MFVLLNNLFPFSITDCKTGEKHLMSRHAKGLSNSLSPRDRNVFCCGELLGDSSCHVMLNRMQQESHMHTKSPGKFFNVLLISADTIFPVQNEESWLWELILGTVQLLTKVEEKGRRENRRREKEVLICD